MVGSPSSGGTPGKRAVGLPGCVVACILLLASNPNRPVPPRSENDLMIRVQAGDLVAFEQLVERYQDMVYGLAHSILRSPEDAEEAAQDAFVKLYRARDRFDGERALEPWLLRIAGNVCRDRLRRRRASRLPVEGDFDGEDGTRHLPDPKSVDPAAGSAGMGHAVRQALGELSERARLPLELKYFRGLTNQQIAAALDMSVSNVKVQVARGKDLLQGRLEREMEA